VPLTKVELLATLKEGELDEFVHEAKSSEAAAINNGGVEDQVEYLLAAGYSLQEIYDSRS
jgi:hypothetical protein